MSDPNIKQNDEASGKCKRCSSPLTNRVNYCVHCGEVFTRTLFYEPAGTIYCVNHPENEVELGCGLCGDPICKECYAEQFDLFSSPVPIPCCPKCATEKKRLSAAYFAEHERYVAERVGLGYCPNHTEQRANWNCIECKSLLCTESLYFTLRVWLFKRVDQGPICHNCLKRRGTDMRGMPTTANICANAVKDKKWRLRE